MGVNDSGGGGGGSLCSWTFILYDVYMTVSGLVQVSSPLTQFFLSSRRKVYEMLVQNGIQVPRYAVCNRDEDGKPLDGENDLIECDDTIEINGQIFTKPFVEKPVSAEDHNIYIYYPLSAGGGCQILFRKIGSRSSVYSAESRVRRSGSYIYEEFMATSGTDVKVWLFTFN